MMKERMRRCHELQRIGLKMETQRHLTVGTLTDSHVGLKRILVLFDYSIVLTVFECYCSYSNIRLKSFSSWETWAICNQSTNQA